MERRFFFKSLFEATVLSPVLVTDLAKPKPPRKIPANIIKTDNSVRPYKLKVKKSEGSVVFSEGRFRKINTIGLNLKEAVKDIHELRSIHPQEEGEARMVETDGTMLVFSGDKWMPFTTSQASPNKETITAQTAEELKMLPTYSDNEAYVKEWDRYYVCNGSFWELKAD